MRPRLRSSVLMSVPLLLLGQAAVAETGTVGQHFDRIVAPLLASRCLECHNNSDLRGGLDLSRAQEAMAGGESGVAIVAGQAEQSPLLDRVMNDEMPPEHPLSAPEKQVLRDWIAAGAKWGTDPIDPFRYSSDRRAGYDWWALQPLDYNALHVAAEQLRAPSVRNPIDAFVLQRLSAAGLHPSEEADRRALARRLSFDLRGLPPTPEEVRAFLADRSADAYERLVDAMLAAPAYGERWARHWLDVARFGESQGFERDKLRGNSWRYRDWVVDAWNSDLPYDAFARLQVAGDVLDAEASSSVVATGFLVAGPYDEVGQNQQSAAMKAVVRQDELEDLVSVVGETFLGLTVHCARCHDHKFDPITQREYYQLAAVLSGVHHGQREALDDQVKATAVRAMQEIESRVKSLQAALNEIDQPIRQEVLARRQLGHVPTELPSPISAWEFDNDLSDSIGSLHGESHGHARVENGWLLLDGQSYVTSAPLSSDLSDKTLEAWVTVFDLGQRGGGVISVQSLDGSVFDALVYGEREARRWLAGSDNFARTKDFAGIEETTAEPRPVHMAIVYQSDGTITGYRNGQPYGQAYKSNGPVRFQTGKAQIVFGLRHTPPGGNRYFVGSIDRARLYDRALSPAEVAASAGPLNQHVSEAEIVPRLSSDQQVHREEIKFEIEQLLSQQSRYNERNVYAVAPRAPTPTHLLARGSTTQPRELVVPAAISAVTGVDAAFGLSADASDADRRQALANWIANEHNPLFARVIVNRLWHYHFGTGLVDTPNDFGFNGGRPSHPELIDWLAVELIRNDWSMKAIQRLIVTSATYRQDSRHVASRAEIDAGNRLLWRKTPLRLEAEAVRDAILRVSGELNQRMHGPGFHDFKTFSFNSQFYEMLDPVGVTFQRRSLYRTWVRSGRNQLLDVLDCPDPSAKAPKRAVTTTPLQALSLLNNSFILRMAESFADRIAMEADPGPEAHSRKAFELALCRQPDQQELAESVAFVERHGLAALCRVLFNSNEFLYVD